MALPDAPLTTQPDPLTPEQRRRCMQAIGGRNTRPEMIVRRGLHAIGWRYRLHVRGLPGRPDLVFPRHRAAIFVHGCFWHGHECPLFRLPATRTEFWAAKIRGNRERDTGAAASLTAQNWRVLTVWECALRGPARRPAEGVIAEISAWLQAGESGVHIEGDWPAGTKRPPSTS